MGYIGDKFSLVFPCLVKLIGHVIQGQSQIAHLIPCVHRDIVLQVTGGKLISSCDDLLQRAVDHEGKYSQHEQHDQK